MIFGVKKKLLKIKEDEVRISPKGDHLFFADGSEYSIACSLDVLNFLKTLVGHEDAEFIFDHQNLFAIRVGDKYYAKHYDFNSEIDALRKGFAFETLTAILFVPLFILILYAIVTFFTFGIGLIMYPFFGILAVYMSIKWLPKISWKRYLLRNAKAKRDLYQQWSPALFE